MKLKKEFLALKQGEMSVIEYRDKFVELSRYAPEEVVDEEKKQELFVEGLAEPLQYQLRVQAQGVGRAEEKSHHPWTVWK
jgi:hypothetical protein